MHIDETLELVCFNFNELFTHMTLIRNSDSYLFSVYTAVQCVDPGTLANSMRSAAEFSYNSNITYTCNAGFELTPAVTDPQSFMITCGSDGTWDSLQQCIGMCSWCFCWP